MKNQIDQDLSNFHSISDHFFTLVSDHFNNIKKDIQQ